MSKRSELVLWYAPDGSYGVCQRHEVGIITFDSIMEEEHRMIDSAKSDDHELIKMLDKIAFRIVNEEVNNV
jgi:hypothetical protein